VGDKMNKFSLILLSLILFSITINAQGSISIFAGYGQSSFDEDLFGDDSKIEQAGYVPVGLQGGFNINNLEFGSIFLGAEFNYAVLPFTFDMSGDIGSGDQTLAEIKINQMFIGALVKVKFGKGNANPFIRLGGGAYMGGGDIEYSDELKTYYSQFGQTLEDEEQDLKTAFGFNVGAGSDFKINPSTTIFTEFVYHMVDREPDEENAEAFTANNWAIQVGMIFGLN
jgi:opacity protein-like surface antigen